MDAPVIVEVATRDEEWKQIRDCFVSSFLHYPLYTYFVRDKEQRPRFLRAYMDANYEVLCQSGIALLLAVKTLVKGEQKIIGGSLFAKQSCNEVGWTTLSEDTLIDAYEKHGLREISSEGMERLISYETWENEKIAEPISKLNMQIWNGFFCAIAPQYFGQGIGTKAYPLNRDLLVANSMKGTDSIHEIKELLMYKFVDSSNVTNSLLAITHLPKSEKFHTDNGMHLVSQFKYEDKEAPYEMVVSVLITKLPDGLN